MSERYRYSRPRSPPLFNIARTSLPINISGWATPSVQVHEHLHVVPSSRREVIPGPRSSTGSVTNGGTITTTYKVKTEPAARGSSVREGSRTRRSTVDTHSRPTVVTTTTRHRPVIHSSGATRPDSPLKNTYRGSEEEYVAVPATSRHGHHHTKHYSATMDNADMSRLAREREASRLHVVPVREPAYTSTRTRSIYPVVSRHADAISDDYGEEGYGYTNPRDLVQHDLNNNPTAHQRSRRDSFGEGRSSRPTSITGYGEIVPRSYETRERGPPPTTRGLDRMRTPVYDLPVARRPGSPSLMAPVEPVQRPAAFEPVELSRRTSASRARPQSMYHENREPHRMDSRGEDYYEIRNDDRRENRSLRHENPVEQRGFGIRDERLERTEKIERPQSRARLERSERGERIERSESRARVDRLERADRPERTDRPDRPDRPSRSDRPDHDTTDEKEYKEHKGRDALAAGLSIAGAALGVNALKSAARGDRDDREDREEREERKRREEEPRRRRDQEERSPIELGGRQDFPPPPRDMPPPPPPRDAPTREVSPPQAPLNARDPKERKSSRDERDRGPDRRGGRRAASEAVLNGTAIDSRSDSSASDEFHPRSHREPPARSDSGPAPTPFNPKDTIDLFALKEALKSKENQSTGKVAPEPILRSRTPRGSTTKDLREAAEIRNDLNERRPREPLATTEKDSRQPRVLSPPREKAEDKPVVKGILRQPKEKFPEDPAPIREGVAPLKDAKKDGIPPDARWTKISRKLVNPEALEAGKERFEAREDFVIVLRVLSRDEVQGYAEVTQRIRSSREELEAIEASDRRRARRERHERHKRERNGEIPRSERGERRHRRRGDERERRRESDSGSDSTEDDEIYERERERPKMLEAPQKRATFNDALMSGGLGEMMGEGSGGGNRVPVGIGSGGGNGRRER